MLWDRYLAAYKNGMHAGGYRNVYVTDLSPGSLGWLRFVLTPAYNEKSPSKTIFAYEYRYDDRGRMVMKILPRDSSGGFVTQYCYDKADRIAYMKDPALGNRYRFYLYDKLGRLCVQGTCSGGNQNNTILSTTTYTGGSGGLCKTGYDAPYSIVDPQLEVVNYYDNYDFIGKSMTSAMPTTISNDDLNNFATGFLTGQVAYTSNGDSLGSISIYDQKGQVVRSVRKGLKGYVEDVSTAYTFTGATDSIVAEVNVRYGSKFTAKTEYTYKYGKKTKMKLSVSHGRTTPPRETEYTYDAVGRLSSKKRQMTGNAHSACSYRYDVHGWLTSITSGEFQEKLYYADGLDGGCYNGNISTFKWKADNDNLYQGYNLKYDANNRLYSAVFGADDNLTSYKNNFNEYVQYDCNGNITRLQRRGLVDNMYGAFGLVDDLYMSYEGNLLTSVRDNSTHSTYAGATDFYTDSNKKEYPLTYNGAGSLVSDAGRKIAKIDYDQNNNPVRIQFTNGNVTKYIYSATGEKLQVTYQTAVPNISVAIGSSRELAPTEILSTDYTDYLLGGSLTLKNGRIDKYQFDEGYCQAEKYIYNTSQDEFTFCYYDKDHLGNVHQVTEADGTKTGYVIQKINYYPFGAQFCDNSVDSNVQPHKYNGKEFDKMHGLNTYDYGARQYNPVTARWDRMDPLAEKYYSISPYAYCMNNPIIFVDPDGMDGVAAIDFDNKTILISQTFYYNKKSEGLNKKGIVSDREINNSSLGHITAPAEISFVDKDGFSSKPWNVKGWIVSFKCEFIGLDSDEAVEKALDANPEANALCYDENMDQNGIWDPASRKLTLGFNRGGLGAERGSTLNHEIGHSWGLPHENLMPNSPLFGVEDNGKDRNGTGIMSYGNYRTIKQYEVEYGVEKILNSIPDNHPSSMKLHIK